MAADSGGAGCDAGVLCVAAPPMRAGAKAEYNELLVDNGMPYEAALAAMQDALADMRAENAPEEYTRMVLTPSKPPLNPTPPGQ